MAIVRRAVHLIASPQVCCQHWRRHALGHANGSELSPLRGCKAEFLNHVLYSVYVPQVPLKGWCLAMKYHETLLKRKFSEVTNTQPCLIKLGSKITMLRQELDDLQPQQAVFEGSQMQKPPHRKALAATWEGILFFMCFLNACFELWVPPSGLLLCHAWRQNKQAFSKVKDYEISTPCHSTVIFFWCIYLYIISDPSVNHKGACFRKKVIAYGWLSSFWRNPHHVNRYDKPSLLFWITELLGWIKKACAW